MTAHELSSRSLMTHAQAKQILELIGDDSPLWHPEMIIKLSLDGWSFKEIYQGLTDDPTKLLFEYIKIHVRELKGAR